MEELFPRLAVTLIQEMKLGSLLCGAGRLLQDSLDSFQSFLHGQVRPTVTVLRLDDPFDLVATLQANVRGYRCNTSLLYLGKLR